GLPGDAVLLIPQASRSSEMSAIFTSYEKLGGFGRTVMELFVTNVLGGAAADADSLMAMRPVESGGDALRPKYTILATSEEIAAKVLGRGESALLDFAANPGGTATPATPMAAARARQVSVLWWSRGLTLTVPEALTSISWLDTLTNLAASLSNAASGW